MKTKKNIIKIVLIIVLFIILIQLPRIFTNRHTHHIMVSVLLYSIVAQALNLLMGFTKYVSFGHAAFYGIGAYASAILVTRTGLPFGLSIIVSSAMAGFVGFVCGVFPLYRRLKGSYFTIVTSAFGMVIFQIMHNWDAVTNGPAGMTGIAPAGELFGLNFRDSTTFYYLALFFAVLVTVIIWRIINSKLGRIFKAIGQDEDVAESIGIHVGFYKIVCFTISAFFTGLAGSLFAHFSRFLSPDMFNIFEAVDMVTMVVLGGTGTIFGPILGSGMVIALPEFLRGLAAYRHLVFSGLLIITVMFFPSGVWGIVKQLIKKVHHKIAAKRTSTTPASADMEVE